MLNFKESWNENTINENIYTCPISSSLSWSLAYSYPVGIEINVLYYDELLVGTSTGLYAQNLEIETANSDHEFKNENQSAIYLTENGSIKVSASSNIVALNVFDIGGKLIYEMHPNQKNFELNENFKNGLYIFTVTDDRGKIQSKKIAITTNK